MKKPEIKNIKMPKIKISSMHVKIACGIIILACVGLYVYFFILYNGEQGDQDDLQKELSAAKLEWERVRNRPVENLDQILDQRRLELEQEENLFPTQMNSNAVMALVIQAAEESQVDILPLSGMGGMKQEKIDNATYYKVDIRLSPNGTLPNVLDFIQRLHYGTIGEKQYGTIVVKDITLGGRGSDWRANFTVSVYSREAPQEIMPGTATSTG